MIPQTVISRYAERKGLTVEQSLSLHMQLDKFLYDAINATGSNSPSEEIDMAWHDFILDTKSYASYCDKRFGKFIHHVPSENDCGVLQCDAVE